MSEWTIRTCPTGLQRQALEMVLGKVPAEQRSGIIEALRPMAEQGVHVFSTLVVAEADGQLVGSAWIQPQVGRTATFWSPVVIDQSDSELPYRLAKHALEQTQLLPVSLVQALLDDANDPVKSVLLKLDFEHLADLNYLMRAVPRRCDQPEQPELKLIPESAAPELFKQMIVESYRATLDCPGLEKYRDIDDTLAGYRTVGQHDPELWTTIHWQGSPVGTLLVSPYPEASHWELIYIGIIPEVRGQGLGCHVLAELEYRASLAKCEHIVLAVDAANEPALKMYDQSKYVEWSHRQVYIKSIDAAQST